MAKRTPCPQQGNRTSWKRGLRVWASQGHQGLARPEPHWAGGVLLVDSERGWQRRQGGRARGAAGLGGPQNTQAVGQRNTKAARESKGKFSFLNLEFSGKVTALVFPSPGLRLGLGSCPGGTGSPLLLLPSPPLTHRQKHLRDPGLPGGPTRRRILLFCVPYQLLAQGMAHGRQLNA